MFLSRQKSAHSFVVAVSLVVLIGFVLSVAAAQAQATFVSISVPGAGQGTFPLEINRSGVIVGYFVDDSGVEHGFIRSANGTFTIVDNPPGSGGTQITAINSLGLVAGFNDYSSGNTAFLRYRSGAFGSLYVPGATFVNPVAMNDGGEIAGVASLYFGAARGFVWSLGHSFTFTVPGAGSFVGVSGLNSSGTITGNYADAIDQRTSHGYVRDSAGNVASFDATNSTKITRVSAINSSGVVTGYYLDSSDEEVQSFVRGTDGMITLLTLAGYQLYATGINDSGVIAGTAYTTSTATPFESDAVGNVTLLPLPFNNVGSNVVAINRNGLVIGTYYDLNYVEHAWLMIP